MKYEKTVQVKDGKAYIYPPSLAGGKYYVSAYYHPNSRYKGSYREYTYYINQTAATGVMDTEVRVYYNGEYITPMAHFQKEGVPLTQAEVEFYLGNQFIGRYWTDENGMAIAPPYQILIEPGEQKLRAKLLDGKDFVGTTLTSTLIVNKSASDLELTASKDVYREQNVTISGTILLSPKIADEETSIELKYTRQFTNGDTEPVVLTQSINPVDNDTFSFTIPILPEETPGYKYATVKVHSSNYHNTCEESVSFLVKVIPHISIVPSIEIGNEYYLYQGNVLDEYDEPYYPPDGVIDTFLINVDSPLEYSSYMVDLNETMFMPYVFDWDEVNHTFKVALLDSSGTLFDFGQFTGFNEDDDWCDDFGNSIMFAADPLPEDMDYIETAWLDNPVGIPFHWIGDFSLEDSNPPGEDGKTEVYSIKFVPNPDVSITGFYECDDPWKYFKGIALTIYDKHGQEMRVEWNLGDMTPYIPTMINQRQVYTLPVDIDGSFSYLQKPQPLMGNHQTRVWSLNESEFHQESSATTNITYIHSNHIKYEVPQKVTVFNETDNLKLPVTVVDNYNNVRSGVTVKIYHGDTLIDLQSTNVNGKTTLSIPIGQYEGKCTFNIKVNDPLLDEEFTSTFNIYIVQEHYFEITTATTDLDEYNKPILHLQLYLETSLIGNNKLYLNYNGQRTEIASNFIRYAPGAVLSLVQDYNIELPTNVMAYPEYILELVLDEFLGNNVAYPPSVATKSLKMVELTSIQNTALDSQTITSNLHYNITADNRDHTITYVVTNPLTNEWVNEGYVAVTAQLVDTIGTIPTTLQITASETEVANNSYISLQFNLVDSMGNPVTQQDINIYQESTLLGVLTTNNNGQASRNVLVSGSTNTIQFTGEFMGDHIYDGCSSNILITITHPPVDPMDGLLSRNSWTQSTSYTPTVNTPVATSTNITTTATTIQFGSRTAYIYDKTMQDMFDPNELKSVRFIVKKTGGDGRFNIGFVNLDTGKLMGYICSATNQLTIRNEETGYSSSQTSKEVKYNEWNEMIFEVENNTMKLYFENQQSRTSVVHSIPLGSSAWNRWYFMVAPTAAGQLLLTTDTSLIQHTAKGE